MTFASGSYYLDSFFLYHLFDFCTFLLRPYQFARPTAFVVLGERRSADGPIISSILLVVQPQAVDNLEGMIYRLCELYCVLSISRVLFR